MKQRFIVGSTAVLMRPGWNPDAFTILNPSDQPVYVREGSADSGVSDSNYDYIVPAGGNLQFPTVANNFSAVQASVANRPAIVLLWTKEEVAPSFGGGSIDVTVGGGFSGYSFGTLNVTNAAPVPLVVPAGTVPRRAVIGPIEGGTIRYRYDGGSPTTTVGALAGAGTTLTLDDTADITQFKAIATGATPASIPYTLER